MQQRKRMKLLLIILCILGWFALTGQFYLIIKNRTTSVPETIIRFFSYFTILTNILVAVCSTVLLLNAKKGSNNFFSKSGTITAIAINIAIVGIIYNIILRALWKFEEFQWMVNEILHLIIPLLFIILWLVFIPKGKLPLKSVLAWLLYPLVYLVFILIRGNFSSFYPYPFIDVNNIGYKKTFINSTGMLLAFLAISFLFVALNRLKRDLP